MQLGGVAASRIWRRLAAKPLQSWKGVVIMAGKKGFAAVAALARRTQAQRGGNPREAEHFERSAADSLAVWRDRYLEFLQVRNYSPETVEGRRRSLNDFLRWAAERDLQRAEQVTRLILEAYQRGLWRALKANGQRLGWRTQRERLSALKDWFRWLTRQNLLLHNPAGEIDLPRMEKRLPMAALSLAQMEALLKIPDTSDLLGVRDRAMLEVFYGSGLRRSEVCRLELSDLNTERRTLAVRLGKGRKDRVVPVGARALHWLERYLREVRPRLCLDTRTQAFFLSGYGEGFSPDVLSRMVNGWLKRLGVRGSCHLLRHTCATHMLEGGADIRYIQQLLGHENLDTTAIYTEVSIKQLQEVHARCHPACQAQGAVGAKPEEACQTTGQQGG